MYLPVQNIYNRSLVISYFYINLDTNIRTIYNEALSIPVAGAEETSGFNIVLYTLTATIKQHSRMGPIIAPSKPNQ